MKSQDKPDPNTISLLHSIQMNPNFLKLVAFSLNCLFQQMYLPNNKHRDNSIYLFREGYETLMKIMKIHNQSEIIILHGSGCVNRMIGLHKFREEYIARCVIESELIPILKDTMSRQLSQECVKQLLDLFQNMTYTQQQSTALAVSLSGLIKMILVSKPMIVEIRRIFRIAYPLLIQVIEAVDAQELATEILHLMGENRNNKYILKESLKLLLLLIRNQRALIIIRQNQTIPVKELSEMLLNNNHNDPEITEQGAKILEQIITKEEIDNYVQSIELLDKNAEFSMGIVASLMPVIHNQLDDIISKLRTILTNHKKLLPRKHIIRDALLSLVRLADQNYNLTEFLNISMELFECEDVEVAGAAIQLTRLIYTDDQAMKIIERTIGNCMRCIVESLKLLLTLGMKNEKYLKAVGKGKETYMKILEQKDGQYFNAKVILLTLSEQKEYYNKKQQIIQQFIIKNPKCSSTRIYLEILNKLPDQQKNCCIYLGFLCILYNKDYIGILKTLKNKQDSEDEDEEQEEDNDISIDCREQVYELAKKMIKQEEMNQFQKDVLEEMAKFVKNKDELNLINLEIAILKLSLIKNDCQNIGLQLTQTMIKIQYQDKKDIFLAIIEMLVAFNPQQSSKVLEVIFLLLDNEDIIQNTLLGLMRMEQLQFTDQNATILITMLQLYLKKYQNNESLSQLILDVIKLFLQNPTFRKNLKDLPRALCRKLPDDSTTKNAGITTIQILNQINYSDNALKYTTQFQNQNQYDLQVIDEVQPYIAKVQKYELYLTQELKQEIMQMILSLQQFTDPSQCTIYLDKLSVHALIDEALSYEMEMQIQNILPNILKYSTHQLNNGLLCSAVNIHSRMLPHYPIQTDLMQNLRLYRHSYDPVVTILKYLKLSKYIVTIDDVDLLVELLNQYEDQPLIIQFVRNILFRSCEIDSTISKKIGTQQFIQSLIRSSNQLLTEEDIVDIPSLEWLQILSPTVSEIIAKEKGVELCQYIIQKKNEQLAFQILINLVKAGMQIDVNYIIQSLQNQNNILFILQLLNELLNDVEFKSQFDIFDGQQLIFNQKENYPTEVTKLLVQFYNKQQVEQIIQEVVIEEQQQVIQEQQEVIQELQQEQQIPQQQIPQQQIPQQQQPNILDTYKQMDNDTIISEGILDQLYAQPQEEVWDIYNRLVKDPEISKEILKPNSIIYNNTLKYLKEGTNCQAVLETTGYIQETEEFGMSDGPADMLNVMQNNVEDKEIVKTGLEAFNKISKEESILYTLGDTNGIELSKQILEKHQDIEIQIQCNSLIESMSVSESYQDKMGDVGLIEELIKQIRSKNPLLVDSALTTLGKVVYKNAENSEKVFQSGIIEELYQFEQNEDKIVELLNNMVHKNEEMRNRMKIDYLVKVYCKNVKKFNKKSMNDCVSALFSLCDKNAKNMIQLGLIEQIIEFLQQEHENDDLLASLNLLLKIGTLEKLENKQNTIDTCLSYVANETTEKPALRILRLLDIGNNFNGYEQFMRVLKRQDPKSCAILLNLIAKLNGEQIVKFDQYSIGIELEDLLRTHKDDLKLYDSIIPLMQYLKKTNELINQLVVFAQQNTLNDTQLKRLFALLETSEDQASLIPFLLHNLQYSSALLVRQAGASAHHANHIYANKGIEASINQMKLLDQNYSNLAKIIYLVAKPLEEYRQQIADMYLKDLLDLSQKLQDANLEELIKYLQGPKQRISKITEEMRQFLMKGEILKMYKEDGSRGYYRIFCSNETLREINWRPDKLKQVKEKWKLNITQIKEIRSDYDKTTIQQSSFNKLGWFAKTINKLKNKIIEPNRCITLVTKQNKVKSYNALCRSESQKQKWVEYLKILMEEFEFEQQQQQQQ